MQLVGILREHESGLIKIGRPLTDFSVTGDNEIGNLEQVISYLNNGSIAIAFLHYVYDSDKNAIGPLIFYTDGKWVWPSYLSHYLSLNYTSLIPDEFIADMEANSFIPPKLQQDDLNNAQKLYADAYNPKPVNGFK